MVILERKTMDKMATKNPAVEFFDNVTRVIVYLIIIYVLLKLFRLL